MKFIRLIIQGQQHAYFNMALDEALSEAVRQNSAPPTLRLYSWDKPSLSIGYFQRASDVNIEYCSKKGYPLVRRLTGGRAVLHDSELTYSFSASSLTPPFQHSLMEMYRIVSNAMVRALGTCGIEARISSGKKAARRNNSACFRTVSYAEITIDGKKVIGSAQKRFSNGFLQHGSILMDFNAKELSRTLGQDGKDSYSDICGVNEYAPGITMDDLGSALKEAFEKELGAKLITDNPSAIEMKRARELERNKYSTPEWIFLR